MRYSLSDHFSHPSITNLHAQFPYQVIRCLGDPGFPETRTILQSLRLVDRVFSKCATVMLFGVVNIQQGDARAIPQMRGLTFSGLAKYIRRLYISPLSMVEQKDLKYNGRECVDRCVA